MNLSLIIWGKHLEKFTVVGEFGIAVVFDPLQRNKTAF